MGKLISNSILPGIAAGMTLLFFVSAVAEAAEFKFGGQMRPRYNFIDHKGFTGFDSRLPAEQLFETRVRFSTEIIVNDKNSAFIQFQGIGIWGEFSGEAGLSRTGIDASDATFDVGFHQAYFIRKNLFGFPIDIQIGRQELVLDGHRLVGNVGWSPGGRSHDAIRLTHDGEHLKIIYMYSKVLEFDSTGLGLGRDFEDFDSGAAGDQDGSDQDEGDFGDNADQQAHILWGNIKGESSATSLYFIYFDAGNPNQNRNHQGTPLAQSKTDIFTIGARHAGKFLGLDYRGEVYYQFGNAENYTLQSRPFNIFTNPLGYANYQPDDGIFGAGTLIDRNAYMFGLRLGKKFSNIPWKPSITLWYDHLSGTDQTDIKNNDFSTFNTLFATQHKYYGLMDLYQSSGEAVGSFADTAFLGNGLSTLYLGLLNFAIKTSVQPTNKFLAKLDWHWFWTDTDLSDPSNAGLRSSLSGFAGFGGSLLPPPSGLNRGRKLGQEVDLTLIYRFDDNFTFSAGYSHYFPTDLFKAINFFVFNNTDAPSDGDWGYAQFDWKF